MLPFPEIPEHSRYGYARVSSKSQEENSSLEFQKKTLMGCGVPESNLRVEVGSAADLDSDKKRLIFNKLVDTELQKNDLLIVTKIDRCSRNTLEFLKLQEKLSHKSILFVSLDLPYSEDSAVNKLFGTMLASIATFETERRKERQKEGILAAKQAGGKYLGRKTVITPKLIDEVRDLKEKKKLSVTQIAKITGKGRNTIYKILKRDLGYIPHNRLVKDSSPEENKSN